MCWCSVFLVANLAAGDKSQSPYRRLECLQAQFFASCGFTCPPFENPADFFLDTVSPDSSSKQTAADSKERSELLARACKLRQRHQVGTSICRFTQAMPPGGNKHLPFLLMQLLMMTVCAERARVHCAVPSQQYNTSQPG